MTRRFSVVRETFHKPRHVLSLSSSRGRRVLTWIGLTYPPHQARNNGEGPGGAIDSRTRVCPSLGRKNYAKLSLQQQGVKPSFFYRNYIRARRLVFTQQKLMYNTESFKQLRLPEVGAPFGGQLPGAQ
jgi:hypothetical protein